jgi:hypothetical protein
VERLELVFAPQQREPEQDIEVVGVPLGGEHGNDPALDRAPKRRGQAGVERPRAIREPGAQASAVIVRASLSPVDASGRIRALVADTPGLASVLGAILDRRERSGRLPVRFTVSADPACAAALAALLSARAVRAVGAGKVRLDLAAADALVRSQHGAPLDIVLYRALGRTPRDLRAEEQALCARLTAGLSALAPQTPVSRAYLADGRDALLAGRGELLAMARLCGAEAALGFAADVVRGVDAMLGNPAPVRRATFAARVLGDSKALSPGRELARAIGRTLVELHPATREDVLAQLGDRDLDTATATRLALESRGVFRDEGAITVHCTGPLAYIKGGERFDQVARHAAQGDVSALTLGQLRGAALDAPIERATVIENQATFFDYIELAGAGELVVLGRGQASYAVVALLALIAPVAPIRIACDLDRSGVLIWRSLARRLRTSLEPVAMDEATHARVADRGRPLTAAERARLASLLVVDPPGAPGHDLLRAIHDRDRWVEQEAFAADVLFPSLRHHPHT